ncbi:sugar ABC transporter permease [Clostridium aestuarii]|uniref:Sugar ABC transporter permease n=1 Tax=Clostridium aestuarii TaxID=338193 RepID=A0ABT4D0E3_9CLOT|nr:sugar ABC transporter permease [Clostridium aestuarii]MCY6484697.1 sugar ABC transporter permease [Clostridium aestuarii]
MRAKKKLYKRKRAQKSIIDIIEPYLYILPAMIVFSLFIFFPFIKTIYLSLNATDSQGTVSSFIGLNNYINLFKSPSFQNSLIVTIKFALFTVVPAMVIGFITAILANVKLKGIGIFRTIYALPMAISSASAAIVWMFLFHPSIGMVNYFLKTNIGWLTDTKWGLIAIAVVTIWMNIGINFIFIIAALQGVPLDLYESAAIDGAGVFSKHLHITIPCISPTLFFLLVINIINTFQAFGQINIMTSGGPGESTNVLVHAIYREAFFNNRFGVASAQSIILFLILLVLTLLQFKFGESKVNY